MQKRAISPLIATILLIGFTVAIATSIMLWSRGLTESAIESASKSQLKLSCTQDIEIDVKKSCYTNKQVEIIVENKKGSVSGGFLIKIVGSGSTDVVPASPTSDIKPQEVEKIIALYDNSVTGSIEEIVIYPKLKVEDKVITCDAQAVTLRVIGC